VFLRKVSTTTPISAISSLPRVGTNVARLPSAIASMLRLSAVKRETMLRPT
jgi:hypothetical protein